MLTFTYRQIAEMETSNAAMYTEITRYVGTPANYGLDTPINVLDIINHIDLGTGLTCMEYIDGALDLGKTLGLELARLCLHVWEVLYPGDSRYADFLSLCQHYLERETIVIEPKKDYCGDLIPGFYGVIPEGQMTDAINSMAASIAKSDLQPTIYEHKYFTTNGIEGEISKSTDFASELNAIGGNGDRWSVDTTPVFDDASNVPPVITPEMLEMMGKRNDPYLFSARSLQDPSAVCLFYQNQLKEAYISMVQCLVTRKIYTDEDDLGLNYYAQALKDLQSVVEDLWSMLHNSIFLLPQLAVSVYQCRANYGVEYYLESQPIYNRIRQLAYDGRWANSTVNVWVGGGDNTFAIAENEIIDAGAKAKAEYLVNYQEQTMTLGLLAMYPDMTREEAFAAAIADGRTGAIFTDQLDDIARGARQAERDARKLKANEYLATIKQRFNTIQIYQLEMAQVDAVTPYLL